MQSEGGKAPVGGRFERAGRGQGIDSWRKAGLRSEEAEDGFQICIVEKASLGAEGGMNCREPVY